MICAGIDAGSRAVKIILFDSDKKRIVAEGLADQGVEQDRISTTLFGKLLKENNIRRKNIHKIIATGSGKNIVSIADSTITEITCHAVGVRFFSPDAMTVIDIGGQDSKIIKLDMTGRICDFSMNDRCAAGTGRFLEIVANRLDICLEKLGALASKSRRPAIISSMCVVFAETEIIGLLACGKPKEDIIAGIQSAIAARIASLAGRKTVSPVIFTGGVAMVPGMDKALESALGCNIRISTQPQMTGAIGAAILASNNGMI
jgi:(R)-2-hydroxyacyl-CoA dehydratese activating ATPase